MHVKRATPKVPSQFFACPGVNCEDSEPTPFLFDKIGRITIATKRVVKMIDTAPLDVDRPMKPAMWNGLRCRCPNCGEGRLFAGYLKVTDRCAHCSTDLHHHRADDGPAYLTILVVGHIMGFVMHLMWTQLRPEPWVMATTLTLFAVVLSLFLLPRLKGLIVAIQWAKRMHGFGGTA